MTNEPDNLGDPQVERLIGSWFQRAVRRAAMPFRAAQPPAETGAFPAFPPPADFSSLRERIRRLEEELAALQRPAGLIARIRAHVREALENAETGAAALLGGLRLAPAYAGVLRSGSEEEFRSGDRVYLHVDAAQPCWVFVALLDDQLVFAPVSPAPQRLEAGSHELGPYRLDENAGVETFVVISSSGERKAEEFQRIVSAGAEAGAGQRSHEEALVAVLKALEIQIGEKPGYLTYHHHPR